jgi:hypothetical protein
MPDKVIRVIEGQFTNPNEDNNERETPNRIPETKKQRLIKGAVIAGVVNQAKRGVLPVVSRIGTYTGNESKQENIQQGIELASMGVTLALSGSVLGAAAIAISTAVGFAFKQADLNLKNQRETRKAMELRRRAGFSVNTKSGGLI